jgi:RNA polymerase sigma factor (sigma-70 family)
MATANLGDFFHRLMRGMEAETLGDHSDRQLVERMLAGRDESAFQAIVNRHGRMVYRVCWRVLQHPQDVEDAFQATFLVLAQKLRTLRKHASLASWLHGVAYRIACKAKAQAAAQRRLEHQAAQPDTLPPEEVPWSEVRAVLDFELSQLPDKWRLPIILCYLEGRTQDESASQLGWSNSTLRRRLEQARTALGYRLHRRGIVRSTALTAVLVSDCMAPAALAPALVASTVEAVARVSGGATVVSVVSAPVAALTEGVMKTMFVTRLQLATATLLFSLAMVGVAGLSHAPLASTQAGKLPKTQGKDRQTTPSEDVPDARLLARKARELDLARAHHRQAEAILKDSQQKVLVAQQAYAAAHDRFVSTQGRSKEGTTVTGKLVRVAVAESRIRVEHWKEVTGDGRPFTWINSRVYEDFPVAKTTLIVQDNVRTKLADLKSGSRLTLQLKGKNVVSILVDGGVVPGPIRHVSANETRNTITVLDSNDERRVYHLVKETEVITDRGTPVRVKDVKESTLLVLTRSVSDTNTVIRMVILQAEKGGQLAPAGRER